MDFYNNSDDNDYEEKDTYKDSGHIRIGKILKVFFKAVGALIVIFVFGIMTLRSYFATVPKNFSVLTSTDELSEAYASYGADLEVFGQNPLEGQDDNGYYHLTDNVMFCPNAGEIQMTIRYNSRNTINVLMEKYHLTERPTGETFVYILRDDKGNEYTSYRYVAAQRPMNEFRRIIFDGVDFTDVETFYLDVYYGEDVSEESPMSWTFVCYDASRGKFPIASKTVELALSKNPSYINNRNS